MILRFCHALLLGCFTSQVSAHILITQDTASYTLAILLSIGWLLICFMIWLWTNKTASKKLEKTLHQHHQELEQRLLEREEKLRKMNHQLHQEITNHEITEALLNKTQDNLQNIINSMPSILIGLTRTGVITHWNLAAYQATGVAYKKALGSNVFELAPELNIEARLIERAIDKQAVQKLEAMQSGHGSQAIYRDITIYPLNASDNESVAIRIDDVTSRINLENMMIQNEKMNSLGELAAGVAHEINNPMGIILQGVQNIKRRLSTDVSSNQEHALKLNITLEDINAYLNHRQITQFIDDIQKAGERTHEIVSNMLTFARAQNHQLDQVDIHELITNTVQMAEQNLAGLNIREEVDIHLDIELPEENICIPCSPIEIQQVLLNLISNAFHAFIDQPLYTPLTVTVTLDYTRDHAVIRIIDNGNGMDAWTQKHIFDPFFTTKEVGKGTGLGLSISYYIISERHHGNISVESQTGKGTTFTIDLPIR